MVDLETLGNNSHSVILSIGAVSFDDTGIGEEFYVNVDPQSCVNHGLQIDVSTVMWWMKQSDDARKALYKSDTAILVDALTEFTLFMRRNDAAYVWGNGATFDNVILSNAYKVVGLDTPWKFYNDRCYRTLKNLFPTVEQPADIGTAHNALDDARWQALHAVNILQHIKGLK